MREGDTAAEFFVIIEGAVRIDHDGAQITQLGAGDFLGEIALVDGRTRSATATTVEPSRLLVVGHDQFHSLMAQVPAVRTAVLRALAERVRSLDPAQT
jgi:CRP-like cAMP-binding protein